jgi:hypothetical protein
MRKTIGIVGGLLAAAVVPAIYFGSLGRSFRVSAIALLLGFLWITLLGLPAFFLLKRFDLARWWSSLIAGFFLASIPMAWVTWPYHPGIDSGYAAWDGRRMVNYVVHGIPTHAGWTQYIYDCCGIGFIGAASAITFWAVWWITARPGKSSVRPRFPDRSALPSEDF